MSSILDKFKEEIAEEKNYDSAKKIRVGIIGTGWIAEAHVKAYQKCPDVEIVALADLVPGKAEAFCETYNVGENVKFYPSHKELVDAGEITRAAGKKVLAAVFESNVDVDKYCDEQGFNAKVDEGAVLAAVKAAMEANAAAVADFRGGKEKAFGAIFGACMKELKGNGDPALIRELLTKELSK